MPWKNKNTIHCLQISVLSLEIFKFEKFVKYANETTDDLLHNPRLFIITWLAPQAGKMDQIARCDWLPERAR